MRSLIVTFALMAGCHLVSGLDSFKPLDGQGGGGGGGDATTGGGMPQGGGGNMPLVDDGLLARYFLGEEPEANIVLDAAPSPLNLAVVPNAAGDPAFVGELGARGAHWDEAGQAGQIFVASGGTKLEQALEGSRTATIEAVVSISDVDSNNTRLVHFGSNVESGRFSLRADATNAPVFFLDNARRAAWDVPLQNRVVLHLVFDSELVVQDRVRLFADGTLVVPAATPNLIDAGRQIDIQSDSIVEFHIGNRANVTEGDGRSAAGTIHYVALYDIAFTPAQVTQNASRLAVSDDP